MKRSILLWMGETYTYMQIMGMSGACFRIAFCNVWDWSALDALITYSYDEPLYKAIGYQPVWACHLEKEERAAERSKIVSDILDGKPVVAINLRVAAEWGVITGYNENGKTLYCRTYFDHDQLNENKDYLKTDHWPFLITHFGDKTEKPSETEILKNSLNAWIDSFEAPARDAYYQGRQAYEKWIEGLRDDQQWSHQCPNQDLERRFDVHLSTVYQLVDARRCAAGYLKECCMFTDERAAAILSQAAEEFLNLSNCLDEFKEKLLQSGVNAFTDPVTGKNTREKQAELLAAALRTEEKNRERAEEVLQQFQI